MRRVWGTSHAPLDERADSARVRAVLLVLSVAGLVTRNQLVRRRRARALAAVAEVAVGYQSAVTGDLGRHARLHADTTRLVGELRALGVGPLP